MTHLRVEWKCLSIIADFWVFNFYMFQFQIICFYTNYKFPFALTYRFCHYWTRQSLNLRWKGKQLTVQNGQSDLEKLYYTQSGELYLEKWHVLRGCFWMQLTVIMRFMNLCSLNFQSMFSFSPRLTDKKKKKHFYKKLHHRSLRGSKFSNMWHSLNI